MAITGGSGSYRKPIETREDHTTTPAKKGGKSEEPVAARTRGAAAKIVTGKIVKESKIVGRGAIRTASTPKAVPIVEQAKKAVRASAVVTKVAPAKAKAAKPEPTVVAILESAKEDPTLLSADFYKRLEQTLADPDTSTATVASISAGIKKLVSKKIPESSPLFALKKVFTHAELLRSKEFEKEPMTEKEALHLAVGLKNEIDKVKQASKKGLEAVSQMYLQKSNTGFARDVHIIGETAHVISDTKLGSGTYKTARRANALALDTIQKSVKLGINLRLKEIEREPAQIKDRKAVLEETVAEMKYQMALQGPGIGPLWGVTVFEENLGEGATAPQISIMAAPAVPLEDLEIPDDDDERLEQNITIAGQVLTGLERCHAAGISHLDLKDANVNTYLDEETGELTAGLADFGYASEPGKGQINPTIGLGSSGTADYTPHELYFNRNYLKERASTLTTDVPKLDMYAFGCMLYERHFQKPTPCDGLVVETEKKYWEKNPETGSGKYVFPKGKEAEIVADVRRRFAETSQEGIEEPYKALAKQRKLNDTQKFEMFIYSLMRLKPEDRSSAAQARELYNSCFSKRAKGA